MGVFWKVLLCCKTEKEDLYLSLEYLDTDLLLAVLLSGDLDLEYISKHVNLEDAKWECGLVLLDGSEGAPEFHRGPDYHLEPSIAELRLHVGGDTHVAEMTQLPEEFLIEQEGLHMGSIPSPFKAEQQVCTLDQGFITQLNFAARAAMLSG